jgi:tetratricopeptide (TPR) repeat protein
VIAFAFVTRRSTVKQWTWMDSGLVIGLATSIIFPTLLVLFVQRGSRNFSRLQIAVVRAEHDKVLRLLPDHARSLKRAGYTPAGIALSVETYRAKALVGLNRQTEAFEAMRALELADGVPTFQFLMALGQVQLAACDFAGVLNTCDRAESVKPDDFMPHFFRAEMLAYHLHRPIEAQAALDRALSFTVMDETRNHAKLVQAAIEIELRRPQQARALLDEALPGIEWRANRTPIAWASVAVAHTFRAIACGMLNDRPEARRSFKLAVPIVSNYRSARELLERARRAAGEA